MLNFAAIDFETANSERSSVCAVGVVIVRDTDCAATIPTTHPSSPMCGR